jgi:hypothetical protein
MRIYRVIKIFYLGQDILKKMEALGSESGKPSKKVTIADCGELK